MIYIKFDPSALSGEKKTWWNLWQSKAKKATEKAIEGGGAPDFSFNDEIWKELKRWLLENVFNGKCAYCERKITYGVMDHYRPKKSVKGFEGEPHVDVHCEDRPHPGYYWLAYHWKNLVPACDRCNTGHKRNLFPVGKARISSPGEAADPDSLDKLEDPLLLHPYRGAEHDPKFHLQFVETGGVVAIDGSPKGENSIIIYGLDSSDLRNERRDAQYSARCTLKLLLAGGMGSSEELKKYVCAFGNGTKPFSAAVYSILMDEVTKVEMEQEEELARIRMKQKEELARIRMEQEEELARKEEELARIGALKDLAG